MVKALSIFFGGLLGGALLISTPDLVALYADHVLSGYVKSECTDKGLGKDTCYFSTFYEPYQKDHPTLVEWDYYFQLGNGPLYWILSQRCTNKPMHNVSALGENSGKITRRQYFDTECSEFNNE